MSLLTRNDRQLGRMKAGRRRGGAVLVEFALVLPIFILAIIGILEFGRVVMLQQILVNAAREGARRAIVPGATTDDVKDLILGDDDGDPEGYLERAGIDPAIAKVAVWDEAGDDIELADVSVGSHPLIQVIVQVPYNGFTSYFTNSKLRARAQMRKE